MTKDELIQKEHTIFQDSFSEEIWANTYKHHTDKTVDDTIYRVASAIASAENTEEQKEYWTEQFYDMLSNFKCTSGGRIYANAGTEYGSVTLMNCYTAPRASYDIDSLENIMFDLKNQTQTLRSEGGWGQSFNYIRPRSSFIYGIGVDSPGSVKFMEIFNTTSDIITAGSGKKSLNKKSKGKIRKGAMMSILSVWHPDILEFITAKQQAGRLTKFNMSVDCSDEFMDRIIKISEIDRLEREGKYVDFSIKRAQLDKWDLIFPDTTFEKYKEEWDGDIREWKVKGYPVVTYNTVSVMWLWNLIMESTYNRAEPGILFLDRANYFAPSSYMEKSIACNPCAEQIMPAGSVCDLGSINLTQMINKSFNDFDYEKIEKYVKILVRFLDNVNDVSKAPLPEYEYSMKNKRRVGVGILGWGSALYMLKTRIASPEANIIRDKLMQIIAKSAYESSIDLAIEKGKFSLCSPRKHAEGVFVNSLGLSDDYMQKLATFGIRNSSLLSIQPTGNTGILANVSSGGMEPVFLHEYVRTVIVGHLSPEMQPFTPKWYEGEWYETDVFKLAKEGDEEILKGVFEGIVYKIDRNRGLTKEVQCEDYGVRTMKKRNQWNPSADWAATAVAMSAEDHLSDLTGFARWVDSAISKTINVPYEYPFENFKNIYLNAYNTGYIKGVTTYRSGTMGTVLAAKDETHASDEDEEIILDHVHLPKTLPATMTTIRAENRKWYITTTWNSEQTRPQAIFVHTNSPEKGVTTEDVIERLTELARKKGIPEEHIALNIEKMQPDNNSTKIARMISLCLRHGVFIKSIIFALDSIENVSCTSFLFQIKKYLSGFIKNGEIVEGERCSECGSKLVFQESCRVCLNCGWSKCG
ncbi:MAG: adenosylcobalamin-dependent ribonucleoside-diphosphate reductase [Bacilli bacterium]|nr:adenosylcobalamin-dependent ribonucleoside-diphosphate reductase [Bacilli bacterium]